MRLASWGEKVGMGISIIWGLGCLNLPFPMLQAPDLLKPKPEELTNNLSYAEMAVLNLQGDRK